MQFVASFSPPSTPPKVGKVGPEKQSGRLIITYRNGSRELYNQATVLTNSKETVNIEYAGRYIHLKGVENWRIEQT